MRLQAILPLPLSTGHYRAIAILLSLMLLSAVTEGFGLILLVPMLTVLGSQQDETGKIAQFVQGIGIPLSLNWLLAIFVVLVLVRAVINYIRTLRAFQLEVSIVDSLRIRTWGALLRCDWRALSAMRQSDNASMLISNVDRVGYGIGQVIQGFATAITLVGVGLAALAISPAMALASVAIGVAVLLAYRGMRLRAAELGKELTESYSRVHGKMAEGLGALRVIKSFGKEEREAKTGASAFADLRSTQFAYMRQSGGAQMALQVGGAVLLAILVWLAIGRWNAGPTQILPLVALFARALPLLASLQHSWQIWSHSRPALDATMELIAAAEGAREIQYETAGNVPRLSDALVLKDVFVHFTGRDRAALGGLDLTFPAGSITAIEGPSGAGKSTLADILGGLIAPDRGTVLIDGVELAGGLRRAWRERVTYVQQEPILFTGTIRENLLWAQPDASEERMAEALHQAAATFVYDLPEQLGTRIGESGRQLSGGERQRLVLARALLREPSLLILDEASSALDAENEAVIAAAVSRLRDRMTIIIIGHRGVLGDQADRVVRLEAGRLADLES